MRPRGRAAAAPPDGVAHRTDRSAGSAAERRRSRRRGRWRRGRRRAPPSRRTARRRPGCRARRRHAAHLGNLGAHLGQEGLPAKAGLDRHDEGEVDQAEVRAQGGRGRRRLDRHADAQAERLCARYERPHRVAVGAGLQVEGEGVGAGLPERLEPPRGVARHHVHVQVRRRRGELGAKGLDYGHAPREVGHKVAVHDVEVERICTSGEDALRLGGELRQIAREHRRADAARRPLW